MESLIKHYKVWSTCSTWNTSKVVVEVPSTCMSMKNVTYWSQIIKYINDPRQPYGRSTSSSKFCYLSLDVVSWAWQLSQGCNQTVPQCMSTTTRATLMRTNLHCQWEHVVFIQRLVLIRIQIDLGSVYFLKNSKNFTRFPVTSNLWTHTWSIKCR
jgi:hypothetical protein